MIRREEIGNVYTVTYNQMKFTVTISEDPEQYKFYTDLGLDIFEKTERELIVEELEAKGIPYKKNSSMKTLKDKLNADSKGND